MNSTKILGLLLSVIWLSGCASMQAAEGPAPRSVELALQKALEEAAREPAVPLPAQTVPVEESVVDVDDHRFDVNAQSTPADLFFMALVDETDENIVVHPDVEGAITVVLNDVTVAEVLDVVSQVYGFSYRLGPAGYMIFPATLQTRIFQVDYLDLQRSGVSRTRVSSGQVSEGRSRSGGVASSIAGGAAAVATGGADSQQISGSNINTTYQTDFWSDLELTLQTMLGNDV